MTKLEAYRSVACNLLLELTEDGADMSWKELETEIDRMAENQQKAAQLERRFGGRYRFGDLL